jgi:tetratricopeptide (TPR) repeat protein
MFIYLKLNNCPKYSILERMTLPKDRDKSKSNTESEIRTSSTSKFITSNNSQNLKEIGETAYNKGDFRSAVRYFKEALRYDPNDEYLYYKIGKLETEIYKNYELGIEYFQKAISVNPKKAVYWQAKGMNLFLLSRGPEAEACFKEFSKLIHERKLMFDAKSLMYSNNHEGALKCFNELIDVNPDETDAYIGKGECLLNMNQSAKARELFKEALRRINLSPRKYSYKKGKCLFHLDQYKEALNCFNEVITTDPKNYSALFQRARLLGRLRRTEEATEAHHKILEIENKDDDIQLLRIKGISFHILGMTQEAIQAYDKILMLYPNDSYILNKKGTFLDYLGRYNEAIECFDRVLKLNPKNVVCLCKKAYSYLKLGKFGEAKKCCEIAEKISADNSFFWNLKGMFAHLSGEYEEAIICFKFSIKRSDSNSLIS